MTNYPSSLCVECVTVIKLTCAELFIQTKAQSWRSRKWGRVLYNGHFAIWCFLIVVVVIVLCWASISCLRVTHSLYSVSFGHQCIPQCSQCVLWSSVYPTIITVCPMVFRVSHSGQCIPQWSVYPTVITVCPSVFSVSHSHHSASYGLPCIPQWSVYPTVVSVSHSHHSVSFGLQCIPGFSVYPLSPLCLKNIPESSVYP